MLGNLFAGEGAVQVRQQGQMRMTSAKIRLSHFDSLLGGPSSLKCKSENVQPFPQTPRGRNVRHPATVPLHLSREPKL